MQILLVVAIALVVAFLAILWIVNKLIYICPPNEVLIFSGGQRPLGDADGRTVGYRVIQGGRGIRVPLFEQVDRMDLSNMPIELRVTSAYSKGGIPLNVQGVANVKISSQKVHLANAIERFLGRPRAEIIAVARETLEGNLRGVLATLTPEEVNQDREKFAKELLHEADADLARLGIELDNLKIQHVSDDKAYLDSLGRQQSAELVKNSRISEAENRSLSAERTAANAQTQEIAKLEAEIAKARAEAARRILEAQTRKLALVAEQKGQVQAIVARAKADVSVQQARLAQVRFQLIADKIKPAEARKAQLIENARGQAARLIEEGKATAAAIRSLAETWSQTGDHARQIFVAQKLTGLVTSLMSTVGDLAIDKVTVIDKSLTAGGGNFAVNAAITAEQLKQTMGVDVAAIVRGLGARPAAPVTPPAPAPAATTVAVPAPPRPRSPTTPRAGA
ncbi:MAG: flotillin family protein [Myxococcales bacterium]|nr:flotillin family protein [Myxococcales bacterium]